MADSFRKEASDCLYEWIIEGRKETLQCCSEINKCSDPALFGTIFVSKKERKKKKTHTIVCLECNSLNINSFFVELLYKINIKFAIVLRC